MLRYLPVVSLLVLTGCAANPGPPAQVAEIGEVPVPAPAPEWIDVPLSAETWWEQTSSYMQGEYEIPVAAGSALEHKIAMNAGDMVVYNLTVEMVEPELLTVEFHGHTERTGNEPGTVMFYTIHQDGRENGSLRAPFTGVHGWYLNNESDQDIVVRLQLAGYYTEE